ncbi:hypothetical protein [Mariniflexile fucanivorans]|uniref:hypothetical protein n=1 Tax=Mariniflexile fucanivorans TaxID=264023 RepID=UPI001404BA25|nr:hypothetical protein [Mariniflexile fucanivorans]
MLRIKYLDAISTGIDFKNILIENDAIIILTIPVFVHKGGVFTEEVLITMV